MKIVGISCSPRKGKSTKYALDVCLQAVKETGSRCRNHAHRTFRDEDQWLHGLWQMHEGFGMQSGR